MYMKFKIFTISIIYANIVMDMLWFNFILGLNFIFLCLKLIIYYHAPKQRKLKFKPRIKLKNNRYLPL